MPTILRPCAYPGCPELVSRTEKYCPEHTKYERREARDYDRQRGTRQERGYGVHWQKLRSRVLALRPLCEDCERQGRIRAANEVHHIDGNPHNNTMDNLMPLCKECHSSRTAKEQGFARRVKGKKGVGLKVGVRAKGKG